MSEERASATVVVHVLRDEFDVYCGRKHPAVVRREGSDGYFGSPIYVGERCRVCREIHSSAGSTIACFERYFLHRVDTDVAFRSAVLALRGKRLACWCGSLASLSCHAKVIAAWVDAHAVEEGNDLPPEAA